MLIIVTFLSCASSLTWCVMISGSSLSPPLFISLEFFLDRFSPDRSLTGTAHTKLIQGRSLGTLGMSTQKQTMHC